MASKPQAPEQEIKEAAATPETSAEVAASANPELQQSYLPVLLPIRPTQTRPWFVKMDVIEAMKIDTDLTGSSGTVALKGFAKVKASKRKEHKGATDDSGDTTDVREYVRAKGQQSSVPRGKRFHFSIGKTTPEGTIRRAGITVPNGMSVIAICYWIKEHWKAPNKPGRIRHNGMSFAVEKAAEAFSQLPAAKPAATP